MSAKKLLTKDERKDSALKVALSIAKKVGAKRVPLSAVAAKQGVTAPLLFHIFKSRAGFTKAIIKAAKDQGIVLPDPMPTVREAAQAAKKRLKPLKAPLRIKLRAVEKKIAAVKKLNAKLSPKAKPAPLKPAVKKLSPKAKPAVKKAAQKPKKVAALLKPISTPAAAPAGRKPLTPAQKAAKAERDRARRNPAAPLTPAGKFASLPKPFEAAIQQVAA